MIYDASLVISGVDFTKKSTGNWNPSRTIAGFLRESEEGRTENQEEERQENWKTEEARNPSLGFYICSSSG